MSKVFRLSLYIVVLAMSPVAQASSNTTISSTETLATTYNLYSPALARNMDGTSRLTLGGWKEASDPENYLNAIAAGTDPSTIFGADKIFVGAIGEEGVGNLTRSFAKEGYHVNDPTILRPPSTNGIDRSKWLYMYFTMLDNNLAKRCSTEHPGNITACSYLFEGHDVGFASSIDDGLSWTFRSIVIPAASSGDGKGAWMPSAYVDGDEIVLYYSSGRQNFNQENIFRLHLEADGFTISGSTEAVRLEGFKSGDLYANVDVYPYVRNGIECRA